MVRQMKEWVLEGYPDRVWMTKRIDSVLGLCDMLMGSLMDEKTRKEKDRLVKYSAILYFADGDGFFDGQPEYFGIAKDTIDRLNNVRYMQTAAFDKFISAPMREEILGILSTAGCLNRLKGRSPETMAAVVVSDAIMLEEMGVTGIMNISRIYDRKKEPFFDRVAYPRVKLNYDTYVMAPPKTAVQAMFERSLRMRYLVISSPAYREAVSRTKIMTDCLKQYFREENLYEWEDQLDSYIECMENGGAC